MTPLCRSLSDREEAVLLMLGDGLSLGEIACRLGLSAWTIRNDRDRARAKLDAASTTHAVAIVVRLRGAVAVG